MLSIEQIINKLSDNADDLTAQGLPEAAADLCQCALELERMTATSCLLEGELHPAAPATLPAKIVLRQVRPGEWVTHMAILQESGAWSYSYGHYFDRIEPALISFVDRCQRMRKGPEIYPWLEHAVQTFEENHNGLAPDGKRLLTLVSK